MRRRRARQCTLPPKPSPRQGAIVGGDAAERIWDAARAQYNVTVAGIDASGANAFNLWSAEESLFFRDDSFIGKVK